MNSQVAHFGLGDAAVVEEVKIEWPSSGITQMLTNVATNQMLTVHESPRLGDVNKDTTISPGDAQSIFQYYLQTAVPDAAQAIAADANCSDTISPQDAQWVFEHYLATRVLPEICPVGSSASLQGRSWAEGVVAVQNEGLAGGETASRDSGVETGEEFPVDSKAGMASKSHMKTPNNPSFSDIANGSAALVRFGRGRLGPDGLFRVPVLIFSQNGIKSFGLDASFHPDEMDFAGLEQTALSRSLNEAGANLIADGVVRVGGYGAKAVKAETESVLLYLLFKSRRRSSKPLEILRTEDGLKTRKTILDR